MSGNYATVYKYRAVVNINVSKTELQYEWKSYEKFLDWKSYEKFLDYVDTSNLLDIMSSMEEKKIIGSGNVNIPVNETVKSGKRSNSLLDSNDMNIKKIKNEFCHEPSDFNNRNYTVRSLNSETAIDQNTINSIVNLNTDEKKSNNSNAEDNDFEKKIQLINNDLFNIDKALMANEDNGSVMKDVCSSPLKDASSCHSSKKEISMNYEILSSNVEHNEYCRRITNNEHHKNSSQKAVCSEIIRVNTSKMAISDTKYSLLEECTNVSDVHKIAMGDAESGPSCSTGNKETIDSISSLDTESNLKVKQTTCTISTSPQKSLENTTRPSNISSTTHSNILYQSRITPTSVISNSNANNNNAKKNEPLIVTAKTLMSEITQTTAKVSIGNTTISVPLLKPVSSNQIMHGSADLQKNQIKHSSSNQISSQITAQKNSKPPTILNIKRGQKINPPTIVSISQLQIKPSNNAKVVQATVLSKKLQMPNKSDNNTNPAINITPIRAKPNFIQSISYPKQPNISIHDISLSTKSTEDQKGTSSATNPKDTVTTENISDKPNEYNTVQLEYPSIILNKQNINNLNLRNSTLTMTTKSTSTINTRGNDSITSSGRKLQAPYERTENPICTTSMKKVVDSATIKVIPPLLTPLSKDTEFKKIKCSSNNHSSNNSKTKDTISSHIVTTGTTVLSTSTDPISSQRVTATVGITCSPKVSTPVFTVPRTISLMLSKNNPHQSSSTILTNTNLETSADVTFSKNVGDTSSKKVPFPKMVSLKKNTVNSQEDSVHQPNSIIPVSSTLTHVYQSSGHYDNANILNKTDILTKTCQPRSESTEISKEDQIKKNVSTILTPEDKKIAAHDSTVSFNQPGEDATLLSKSPTNKSPPRTEDSQNILLKQLLKNTSPNATHGLSTTVVSSICSQVLSTRKIVNVRAPSLGLVSSLEAQLARPVIPPVPAPNGTISHSNCATVEPVRNKSVESNEQSSFEAEIKDTALDNKFRQPIQTISKETSFVSNPKVPLKLHNTSRNTFLGNSTGIENNINSNANHNIGLSISASSNKSGNQSSEGISTTVAITQIAEQKNRSSELEIKNAQFNTNKPNKEMFATPSNTISLNESDVQIRYQPIGSTTEKTKARVIIKTSSDLSDMSISQSQDNSSVLSNNPELQTSLLSSPLFNENMSAGTSLNNQIPSASKKKDEKGPPFSSARYVQNPTTTVTPYLQVERISENNESIKETEQRKKRKRDIHKHKRQLIKCKRDSSTLNDSTNSKKRLRKCSKIEEDYDMYIDNLLIQMKQMTPLQVLEPFLCKNFGICPMHGSRHMTEISGNKEFGDCLLNQYIRGQHDQRPTADYYDVRPFGKRERSHDNSISMQNDFYDQEFLSHLHENENQKYSKLINTVKEIDVDNSENIFVSNSGNYDSRTRVQCNKLSQTNFPGIISNTDEYLGRISPVIPFVEPVPFKYKSVSITNQQVFEHSKPLINSNVYKDSLTNESPIRNQKITKKDEQTSVTVILTLTSSDALNIMGVLKDLSNILKIHPISTYEVMDGVSNSSSYSKLIPRTKKNRVFNNFMEIQDILNNKRKLCRCCGSVVNKMELRVPYKSLQDVRSKINFAPEFIYFCSKECYSNFKDELKSNSELSPLNSTNSEREKLSIKSTGNYSNLSKKCRFKYFKANCFQAEQIKTNSQNDISDIFLKYNISISPNEGCNIEKGNVIKELSDTRYCILCNQKGDGVSDGPSRLLNFDVDKWVHLNCALWSNGVYETISGGLMNVEIALQTGVNQVCSSCHLLGATIKCFKSRCSNTYHLLCAKKEQCVFYKNKTIHCQGHALKSGKENELSSLSVHRRVFVERDESRQVATIMHHSDQNNLLRVGSLIFLNVGQLLPHQLDAFHTTNYIYPVGYKAIRFYWSMEKPSKRCRYTCSVAEVAGRPEFRVQVQDHTECGFELRDSSPNAVWKRILEPIVALRKKCKLVQIFPEFISGDELFGFNEPSIVRILESLPGIETLTDYRFKYGRNPLLELPLAIHPSGAARTEPKQRQVLGSKKHHTQRTASTTNQRLSNSMVVGEVACPYSKQFVHSKSSQYKKMKQEWRNNVYLARSKIQGLGLYAARDLEKHTMIIEYIGEVIRTEVSEIREKQYEARNRGIYMFRLDEDRVVDATLSGGLARYINHSCNPNCVTEIVDVDRELRIIIFAKRRINRGEELSYDYKFDIEDDAHKLSCMCGSSNCKKWMN